MPVGNIFLSYRRIDTAGHAGRIFDRLNLRFPGRIFRDVYGIRAGMDFVEEIERKLSSCDLLVVVIGPQWLGAGGEGGRRRIDEKNDFVRLEVAAGLRRGIRVIPVLVNGAAIPKPEELPEDLKPLASRHAIEITEPDFDHDVKRLIEDIEELFGLRRTNWKRRALAGAGAGAAVLAALAFVTPWGLRTTVTPAQLDVGPPPGSQSPTPRAKPANAAAEKKKEASPTPTPPPATTPTPPAPPALGAADFFDPVGRWRVSVRHDKFKIHFHLHLDAGGTHERRAAASYESFVGGKWQYDPGKRTLSWSYRNGDVTDEEFLDIYEEHEGHYHARWRWTPSGSKQRSEEVDVWRKSPQVY